MNQNSEHINQDSSLRWNKTSTQKQTNSETPEQQKSNSWTPVIGLTTKHAVCRMSAKPGYYGYLTYLSF